MKRMLSMMGLSAALAFSMSQAQAASHHVTHQKQVQAASVMQQKSVDINAASAKQLAALKGIGDKKAQAIVQYRQQHGRFKEVDDLMKVRGVGPKLLARVKRMNAQKLIVKP